MDPSSCTRNKWVLGMNDNPIARNEAAPVFSGGQMLFADTKTCNRARFQNPPNARNAVIVDSPEFGER